MPALVSLLLGATLGLPILLGLAIVPERPRNPTDIVYGYGVTSSCATLSPEVDFGFRREPKAVAARFDLSEADAMATRIEGWVAADAKWSNRGLGGYRAWCATGDVAAAQRFLDIARGRIEP